MPKSKSQKSNNNKTIPPARTLRLAVAAIFLSAVLSAAVFLAYVVRHSHVERGQFNVSDTFAGEDLFRSLDLKLAAKASYPSAAIKIVQDLGTQDQLQKKIFQFDVKDDGLTEYGLMLTPQSPKPPGGYPVLILLHGYFNPARYSTQTDYLSDMEFYARHGFLVLKPVLRGQGMSFDAGQSDSAYYSMSYNTDLMSLISAVKRTEYANKSEINLWGHSMGAYLALRAAVLSKDVKSAILLSGPVDSLPEMYLTYIAPSDEDNPYALATRNDVFSKYGTPTDDSRFWRDASPIYLSNLIKARLQINVGLEDSIVPPRFSADLDAALTKAHQPHQYFAYPAGRHGLGPQRDQIYSESLKLFSAQPNAPNA